MTKGELIANIEKIEKGRDERVWKLERVVGHLATFIGEKEVWKAILKNLGDIK